MGKTTKPARDQPGWRCSHGGLLPALLIPVAAVKPAKVEHGSATVQIAVMGRSHRVLMREY